MTASRRMSAYTSSTPGTLPVDGTVESDSQEMQRTTHKSPDLRHTLTDRLMADMDPELLAFLRTKANSFIKWDLIHFFNENRCAADTPENIARYIGRDVAVTERALEELAAEEMLCAEPLRSMTVYSLATTPEEKETFLRFVEASKDRQFRAKAIYHMLRNLR